MQRDIRHRQDATIVIVTSFRGSVEWRWRTEQNEGATLDTPFTTADPFWGQNTWKLTGLPPKRDRSSKRLNPHQGFLRMK